MVNSAYSDPTRKNERVAIFTTVIVNRIMDAYAGYLNVGLHPKSVG